MNREHKWKTVGATNVTWPLSGWFCTESRRNLPCDVDPHHLGGNSQIYIYIYMYTPYYIIIMIIIIVIIIIVIIIIFICIICYYIDDDDNNNNE